MTSHKGQRNTTVDENEIPNLVTFVDFVRGIFGGRIILVRPERMTEAEMDEAIGRVAETHPTYKAFMQLIDQFEEEAHDKADADIYIPRALEAHTGGSKYLRALRQHILARRERVAKKRRVA